MNERTAPGSLPSQRPDARRFVRAAIALSVEYTIDGDVVLRCESSDLGGGGLRLAMENELVPGTILTLRFYLPGDDREIVARGSSVMSFYSGPKPCFMHGVAFTQIDPADRARIVSLVERTLATGYLK
jgi:c-di-GMP-binding flagellar brake protein YcgR